MEDCAARGLDVNVWTVNTEKDLLYCRDMGVHAVITNYPAKAVELFGRKE
jgi:glycerophosphoryl diester phosphodiesterase